MSIENCIDESEFEGDIKVYMEGYFDEFLDKYNEYVLDIINITMTNEYTEFEEKKLEPNITTKPAKLEGETFKKIMTKILFEKAAAVVITSGPINKHEATVSFLNKKIVWLENQITQLNKWKNLEVDVTVKERIILEKYEENTKIWEKVKVLERNEEKEMDSETNMDMDNKIRSKKSSSRKWKQIIRVNKSRFIILYFNKEMDLMSVITESMRNQDIEKALQLKKQDDFIDESGELK
ncbi:hypothetical protein RhiirC2_779443 [Rhizophagus irregularis]|uniref:Uncharacterized protein n=1 Tax=Rhizophagus irregularis TaxID=588596 RepID=A0A2N1N9N1_9GLOM|nr:hypothetical protein RhiirC2_779443 [Rhizophagus irregularis]